jgi:hypothetical protein
MIDEPSWAQIDEPEEDVRWALTPLGADLLADGSERLEEMCERTGRNLGVVVAK